MTEVVCHTANVAAVRFYRRCQFEQTDEMPMGSVAVAFLRKELGQ